MRGKKQTIVCHECGCTAEKLVGTINRNKRQGLKLYCSHKCSWQWRLKENQIWIHGDIAFIDVRTPKHTTAVCLVDVVDLPLVNGPYRWTAYFSHGNLYARRKRGESSEAMHVVIMGTTGVDHIDGDTLDNRRSNLRFATNAENSRNQRKTRHARSSQYKGVTRFRDKWMVQVIKDYKHMYLGLYRSEEEAARVYDAAALEHFGEFARLNFPTGETNG